MSDEINKKLEEFENLVRLLRRDIIKFRMDFSEVKAKVFELERRSLQWEKKE